MINQFLTRLMSLPKLPVAILILLAATFWLDNAVQPQVTVQDDTSRRDPDFMIEGLSAIRMGHDGMGLYKLSAKKLLHYSSENVDLISPMIEPNPTPTPTPVVVEKAVPLTPKAQTPDKLPVRLKADLVELYGSNDEIYLSGNVSLLRDINKDSNKKLKIVTSSLSVFPDKNVVRTDKAVFITEGSTTINAVGMEVDNDSNVTRLLSQVRVVHEKKR
ncbi:MAG: LPS export ABC transporter periplasmic protein LptC [Nitrosospira sp.]|nr:LPS export ABC transporter periplasmic protein LptC [Nitrosospira sp.]MBI0413197.1 LPS export ABC transporter periplasmic protein LptC [Nitrosospira sp.]